MLTQPPTNPDEPLPGIELLELDELDNRLAASP